MPCKLTAPILHVAWAVAYVASVCCMGLVLAITIACAVNLRGARMLALVPFLAIA